MDVLIHVKDVALVAPHDLKHSTISIIHDVMQYLLITTEKQVATPLAGALSFGDCI